MSTQKATGNPTPNATPDAFVDPMDSFIEAINTASGNGEVKLSRQMGVMREPLASMMAHEFDPYTVGSQWGTGRYTAQFLMQTPQGPRIQKSVTFMARREGEPTNTPAARPVTPPPAQPSGISMETIFAAMLQQNQAMMAAMMQAAQQQASQQTQLLQTMLTRENKNEGDVLAKMLEKGMQLAKNGRVRDDDADSGSDMMAGAIQAAAPVVDKIIDRMASRARPQVPPGWRLVPAERPVTPPGATVPAAAAQLPPPEPTPAPEPEPMPEPRDPRKVIIEAVRVTLRGMATIEAPPEVAAAALAGIIDGDDEFASGVLNSSDAEIIASLIAIDPEAAAHREYIAAVVPIVREMLDDEDDDEPTDPDLGPPTTYIGNEITTRPVTDEAPGADANGQEAKPIPTTHEHSAPERSDTTRTAPRRDRKSDRTRAKPAPGAPAADVVQ